MKKKSGQGGSVGMTQKVIASEDQTWQLIKVLYSVSVRWDAM